MSTKRVSRESVGGRVRWGVHLRPSQGHAGKMSDLFHLVALGVSVRVRKVFGCNEAVAVSAVRVYAPENDITRAEGHSRLDGYTEDPVEPGFR